MSIRKNYYFNARSSIIFWWAKMQQSARIARSWTMFERAILLHRVATNDRRKASCVALKVIALWAETINERCSSVDYVHAWLSRFLRPATMVLHSERPPSVAVRKRNRSRVVRNRKFSIQYILHGSSCLLTFVHESRVHFREKIILTTYSHVTIDILKKF